MPKLLTPVHSAEGALNEVAGEGAASTPFHMVQEPQNAPSAATIEEVGCRSQPPSTFPVASDRPSSAPNITKAPVRYNLPPPPPDLPATEAELEAAYNDFEEVTDAQSPGQQSQKSLRPGQHGFAERLMSKYGWTKGTGLGASGSGIKAPLRVQLEKQKKKPDSEGGGFVGPGGMGRILGGQRQGRGKDVPAGKFGAMSEVIVLKGMLDGMNVDAEMGAGDGGLVQEIGEECGEKVNVSSPHVLRLC